MPPLKWQSPTKRGDEIVAKSNYTRNGSKDLSMTMGSFNFGDKLTTPLSEMKNISPKKSNKVHPSEIPHLHDAFTKARGHFNIEHMEAD
jgi:hypothetical protein